MFKIDYLEIRPQVLAHGLSRWNVAAGALEADWKAAVAKVESAMAAEPWGHDAIGTTFRNAYMSGDGPHVACRRGSDYVGGLTELGTLVRQAAENCTGMDADQARAVRTILARI